MGLIYEPHLSRLLISQSETVTLQEAGEIMASFDFTAWTGKSALNRK
jgi:hypothetical protein